VFRFKVLSPCSYCEGNDFNFVCSEAIRQHNRIKSQLNLQLLEKKSPDCNQPADIDVSRLINRFDENYGSISRFDMLVQ
jgi:hypothetical protein